MDILFGIEKNENRARLTTTEERRLGGMAQGLSLVMNETLEERKGWMS